MAYGVGRFRGNIAWGGTCATGGENEAAFSAELLHGGFDVGLFVGNCEGVGGVGGEEMGREVGKDGWTAAVLVFTAEGTVRDGQYADGGWAGGSLVGHGEGAEGRKVRERVLKGRRVEF